jgi:hypothetical protein
MLEPVGALHRRRCLQYYVDGHSGLGPHDLMNYPKSTVSAAEWARPSGRILVDVWSKTGAVFHCFHQVRQGAVQRAVQPVG